MSENKLEVPPTPDTRTPTADTPTRCLITETKVLFRTTGSITQLQRSSRCYRIAQRR